MTQGKKRIKSRSGAAALVAPPLLAEIRKAKNSASITMSGIVSITDLSDTEISLATHAGRVIVKGECLKLVIFEGCALEINGKIEEVTLGYAKI